MYYFIKVRKFTKKQLFCSVIYMNSRTSLKPGQFHHLELPGFAASMVSAAL